jgi:hypothetical protein
VPEVHDQGRKHFYRLRFVTPIPAKWGVVLAEAVHDLRSALDQAVYWLTVDWQGKPVRDSSFPVYTRRAKFYQRDRKGAWSSSGGMYKIRGIGPGPRAFIEALQPYPQRYRRFYCRDLRTIHDVWNQDKHRLVHVWGLRFRETQLGLHKNLSDCAIYRDRRVLHDRAIAFKVVCRTPHPKVQVKGEVGADLTFRSGRRRGGGQESLWNTARTVEDVISKLVYAIGRQDDPVTLDTWTAKRPFL